MLWDPAGDFPFCQGPHSALHPWDLALLELPARALAPKMELGDRSVADTVQEVLCDPGRCHGQDVLHTCSLTHPPDAFGIDVVSSRHAGVHVMQGDTGGPSGLLERWEAQGHHPVSLPTDPVVSRGGRVWGLVCKREPPLVADALPASPRTPARWSPCAHDSEALT